MHITWLGHSGFRIEIEDQVLLIDPWLGNPLFVPEKRAEAIAGATHILLTHGHFDHADDTVAIAKETGAAVVCIFDLAGHFEAEGLTVVGFNKGGTVKLGAVAVTMVNAVHSFGGPGPIGAECGYMIAGEGKTIYVSGDTDVTADMGVFQALHEPDIGILSCGGHFTMDMKRAAYAARTFFDFRTVIPCHYRTFPLLEQSAQRLIDELPGVDVREPQVMEPITL